MSNLKKIVRLGLKKETKVPFLKMSPKTFIPRLCHSIRVVVIVCYGDHHGCRQKFKVTPKLKPNL